jgi:hypothetical protein
LLLGPLILSGVTGVARTKPRFELAWFCVIFAISLYWLSCYRIVLLCGLSFSYRSLLLS